MRAWSRKQVERHEAGTLATEGKFDLVLGDPCPSMPTASGWATALSSGGTHYCRISPESTQIVGFSDDGIFAICQITGDSSSSGTICGPGALFAYPRLMLTGA